MIFSQERDQLRKMYQTAWQKSLDNLPLSPLELNIVEVIQLHPEYQKFITSEKMLYHDFTNEDSNPFLHLSLHLGLREQITTDRPAGILSIYRDLCEREGDFHNAEHKMIEVLAECIWQVQHGKPMPDEEEYLQLLRVL